MKFLSSPSKFFPFKPIKWFIAFCPIELLSKRDGMNSELELEQARHLVKDIDIPVRPTVLQKIMELQSSDDPSIDEIAKVISGNVSLSAGVLKAENSPL